VDGRLYLVLDAASADRVLEPAMRGGVDVIQLREKEASDDELIEAAAIFRAAADRHGVPFLLNDRPDLVEACRADGVHLGQDDMPVADARRLLGARALIGLSTHSRDQIEAAADVDYIGVGPVYATPTKEGRPAVGLELVHVAAEIARTPWFAIGGIDATNVRAVVDAGATRVAVVRAIRDADDPEAAARALRRNL
jgi:thiamine-phosphate pyrophosphorylase